MTLTTHAVTGAAIASLIPQYPIIVFCAAFASHFIIDAIPHWDYPIVSSSVNPLIGDKMKYDKDLLQDTIVIGGDILLGIFLSLWLFASPGSFGIIFLGACSGMLPDPLHFFYARFRHEPLVTLQRFHLWIHTDEHLEDSRLLGIGSQILLLVAFVLGAKLLH